MRIRVALIGKPFGISGEVTVRPLTDEPDVRFVPGVKMYSREGDLILEEARVHGKTWLLRFAGVTDRNAAESLRGRELEVEISAEEVPADPDEWFDRDLIGLVCTDKDGDTLGNVIAVEHPPAHDVLVVRTEAGHVARIPFVASIVLRVDQDGIQIDPPGGLLSPDLDPDA
ncbi:MAG: ribosome maturation factor RimM [Micrococcales bacterium]|nr:ribosome maturation factor RimM [Micrococcales bacterium]